MRILVAAALALILAVSDFAISKAEAGGRWGAYRWCPRSNCYVRTYYYPPKVARPSYSTNSADNSITYHYEYTINNTQPVTAQGATSYAYSSADLYSNVDIGALYNAAIRLASDSNQYGAAATANAQQLVGRLGQENTRVAEILAKGHVAASVLKEASGPNELHLRQEGHAEVGDDEQPARNDLAELIQQKCISCHSASAKMGGLVLSDLGNLSDETWDKVLFRITGAGGDPDKAMPLAPGSTAENPIPGEPLNVQQLKVFFNGG